MTSLCPSFAVPRSASAMNGLPSSVSSLSCEQLLSPRSRLQTNGSEDLYGTRVGCLPVQPYLGGRAVRRRTGEVAPLLGESKRLLPTCWEELKEPLICSERLVIIPAPLVCRRNRGVPGPDFPERHEGAGRRILARESAPKDRLPEPSEIEDAAFDDSGQAACRRVRRRRGDQRRRRARSSTHLFESRNAPRESSSRKNWRMTWADKDGAGSVIAADPERTSVLKVRNVLSAFKDRVEPIVEEFDEPTPCRSSRRCERFPGIGPAIGFVAIEALETALGLKGRTTGSESSISFLSRPDPAFPVPDPDYPIEDLEHPFTAGIENDLTQRRGRASFSAWSTCTRLRKRKAVNTTSTTESRHAACSVEAVSRQLSAKSSRSSARPPSPAGCLDVSVTPGSAWRSAWVGRMRALSEDFHVRSA